MDDVHPRMSLISLCLIILVSVLLLSEVQAGERKKIELPPVAPTWWDATPIPEVYKEKESLNDALNQLNGRIDQFLSPQRITKFWFIGPFTNDENVGRERVFKAEEDYLKNGFNKNAEYDGKTGRVRWTSPDQKTVDLNVPSIVMYAYIELDWQKTEEMSLHIFADDGLVLWVNRKEVFRRNDYGESDVPVALQQGRNELFFKVINDGGPWGLWIDTMKVLPNRCRYKALAQLVTQCKGDEPERQRVLSELVRTASDLGDRESFKHWTVTGARVLAGKRRNEFLKDALRRLEEKNYGDVVPVLAKEMTSQDLEEDTWLLWARAQQVIGNFDKSMDIFRQVMSNAEFSEKGRFAAGLELARLLASLGDHRGATEVVGGLLEKFPAKKEDKEFARTRAAIEAAREANIVLDLDDDYERAAERVDRFLQSQKERDAFRSLQRSLLSSGGKGVRTDDPQLYVGAACKIRELMAKHRSPFVAFLQGEQDDLWKEWRRLRRPALATEALRQEMDAAAEVDRWIELAAWEFERGNIERAGAFMERARVTAPKRVDTPAVKELAGALSRAVDAARSPEPLGVKGVRSWTVNAEASFFLSQSRDRQDLDNPEALYLPAERDGVFYFANEEGVTAMAEGKPLWRFESGGLACSEVMSESDVLLPAPCSPVIEDTRVLARVLVPESGGADGRFAIVCLDRLSGREIWRTNGEAFARTHITSPPCLEGGRVLVTALTRAGQAGDRSELYLFVLDHATGAVIERLFLCANPDDLDGIRTATSIAEPGRDAKHLYFDTGMGLLVCMDRATLQLKWFRNYPRVRPGDGLFRSRLLKRVNSSPASDGGLVTFAPADSAFVFFLDAETGKEVARMSSLVFRSLLGMRGETAYFLGDVVTAVNARTGAINWQAGTEAEKLASAWLGRKEALVQCGLRTKRLDLEKGIWIGDSDLPSGLTLQCAQSSWAAGLKGGRYVIFDRRAERPLPVSWRMASSASYKPMTLNGSPLPIRETGLIPYPGVKIAGFWYGGKEPAEEAVPEGLFFQSQGWFGLYDVRQHREVWKRVTSGGWISPQGDRVVHIEGNKRKLEVVEAATGKNLFTWIPQRRVRQPALECPLLHGDEIMFFFANYDWATKREMNLLVYNMKDQTQVKAVPYGDTPAPKFAFWDETFYAIGFWHPWESEKKAMIVTRPMMDEKPQFSGLWGRGWFSAQWEPRTHELVMASPDGHRVAVGKAPFGEKDVHAAKVDQKHTWGDAKFHYEKGLYANARYLVSPWFVSPRVVLDRATLQPVKLPDEADMKELQPMPVGQDQLLYCGPVSVGKKQDESKRDSLREPPSRVLFLFKDGQARPIGEIKPYYAKEYVNEEESRWMRDQLRYIFIKPDGPSSAWVFVTTEDYNEWKTHTVWQPCVAYRADLNKGITEGPFNLPMCCTGDITICGRELAIESPGGLLFVQPEKGPLASEDSMGVTARYRTGEFFLLDGFLNEWKPDEFTEIRKGVRMAATFDGNKIRLAGVLSDMAQGRFTGENLRLVISFLANGFYRGMPLPWMRDDVRLGEITADGDGMQYTVAANGDLRFEAELPMRSVYQSRRSNEGDMDLVNPHSFRMRLDLLDPGVPGGVLATLGGSHADLRPYEMLWFRLEPVNLDEFTRTFFDGGQWLAGSREAKWFGSQGTYFLFRPKDKQLLWTLQRSIPRNAWLDFGVLRSFYDAQFKIRVFAQGKLLAEKEVTKGMAGEPFRVNLAPFGGESVLLRVEFDTKGDWPPVVLQQIKIAK